MPAKKPPPPRLPDIPPEKFTPAQQALIDAIRSGPRGQATQVRGPFAVFMHAPDYGQLAQALGGFCRLKTRVPPRLSEFAILATARIWRSQYEWFAHAGHAARAGVSAKTIAALRAGRLPSNLPKDERAVYDFIKELYRSKRVSDRVYARLHAFLGDEGMVEFVGLLGYYVLVAMSLNVFRMGPPAGEPLPFRE
ncbi:MAG TPA: carboxymuconolactone decarboxylase family protein [Xanthobacteraceae bacterium]|nr:carboxymuconolactone decarboxylase family protein [Xanthobacteraceae bacterium]